MQDYQIPREKIVGYCVHCAEPIVIGENYLTSIALCKPCELAENKRITRLIFLSLPILVPLAFLGYTIILPIGLAIEQLSKLWHALIRKN